MPGPAANLDPATQVELADMAIALANNPKSRKLFARAAKEAGLPVKFHDIEAETATLEATGKMVDDRLAAEARARAQAETTARLNAQRAKLVKSDANPDGRFTEEVVKDKLEPFMAERGIADYDDAAILFNAHNPPAAQRPEIASRGIWELPTGDWLKDQKGTARKMAHQAVADIVAMRR